MSTFAQEETDGRDISRLLIRRLTMIRNTANTTNCTQPKEAKKATAIRGVTPILVVIHMIVRTWYLYIPPS